MFTWRISENSLLTECSFKMLQNSKYFIGTFLWLILLTVNALADSAQENTPFSDIFQTGIQETNAIATKTKLNVDEMPAFVTILYQEDLLRNGINSVFEALSLVPGVELFTEATGIHQVIFRGVKEKGKVKLMLDGIDISNTYRGSIYYYYDFPIELIKRIEVIRGPGSELYGSGAMSGVINIVTEISDPLGTSRLFGAIDSYGVYRGGMLYSKTINAWHLGGDGYYSKGNKGIDVGPDKAGTYGRTNEGSRDYSVGMVAENSHVTLSVRLKESQNGIAFGGHNYLEPDNSHKGLIVKTFFSEALYSNTLMSGMEYTGKVGYSNFAQEVDSRLQPTPAGDLYSYANYKENKFYAEGYLTLSRYTHHIFTGGIRFEDQQVCYDTFRIYQETTPETSLVPTTSSIQPDGARLVTSLYLNDQYSYNDAVDFSVGLRRDIDSDADNPLSARLGMVYRQNDDLSYKALYSHAYRIPSWIEMYIAIPGPFLAKNNLSSEKSDTVEFGAIYKNDLNYRLGANVYCTWIHDLITYDQATVSYSQGDKNRYVGTELTWKYNFSENTDIDTNLAYVYATDPDNNELPDIAKWLGNITASHTFANGLVSTTRLRLVSKRTRDSEDPRSDLDGYATVDQTLSYRYKQVNFIASLKNVFDANVRYPAPADTYVDDYPRDGRTALFMISWEL